MLVMAGDGVAVDVVFTFGGSEAAVDGLATGTLVAAAFAGASLVALLTSGPLSGAADAVEDVSATCFGSLFLFLSVLPLFFGSFFASDFFAASPEPLFFFCAGATLLALSGVGEGWPSVVCVRAAKVGTTVASTMAVRDK